MDNHGDSGTRQYPMPKEGFPYGPKPVESIMLRRMTQVALGGLVVAIAVSALVVSAGGDPNPGVFGEFEGGLVAYVVPGSPAWRDGIRSGQRVLEHAASGAPGGWRLLTMDGDVVRGASGVAHVELLRLYVWWAVPALIFATIVGLLGYRRHRASAVLIPVALAVVTQPLFAAGRLEVTTAGGVAIFLGGSLAVAAYGRPERRAVAVLVVGLALACAWIIATFAVPPAFDAIDGLRAPAALGFALLGLASVTDRRRVAEFLTDRQGVGFVDLAYLGGTVGLAAALAILGFVPTPILIGGTIVGLAAYPIWRRRTLTALDRVLSAPARRKAIIRAVESERGRLAREIHDAPLQELTGVIRRLESLPGAEESAIKLRGVAAQLRDVATTLHPPVLQDLGLAAAIHDYAEQLAATFPDKRIHASVDDLTGGDRPPEDVELAAFRVIQEASANSMAHSRGDTLGIRGAVFAGSVHLTIADDGPGIDPALARTARRNGHFGLDSMRERAEAIGASCTVTSEPDGVTVTFAWEDSD